MKLMRHCRQCRADAVGLLGEDRSQEFTKEKFMEMAADYSPERRQAVHIGIEQAKAQLAAKRQTQQVAQPQASPSNSPRVLVAVASKGGGLVNQHFGHAKEFMIYEVDAATVQFVGHRKILDYCHGGYGEEAALQGIIETISDCQAILALKVGPCPQKTLQAAGLQVIEAYDVIENVARQFYDQQVLAVSQQ
jgi:nitrogen fixation protein NifB